MEQNLSKEMQWIDFNLHPLGILFSFTDCTIQRTDLDIYLTYQNNIHYVIY